MVTISVFKETVGCSSLAGCLEVCRNRRVVMVVYSLVLGPRGLDSNVKVDSEWSQTNSSYRREGPLG